MIRQVLGGLLSGVLLILAFPPFNLEFIAWFAFVPLFLALGRPSCRRPFLCAYTAGLVFWLGTIYWLMYVTVAGTIVLCFYLALYFGLFGRLIAAARVKSLPGPAVVFFAGALWVCLEYLRSYLLTGFPWALLGYSQYLHLPVLQIADSAGTWGVSFIVMLVNAGIAVYIRQRRLKVLLICLLAVAAVHAYGYWRLAQNAGGIQQSSLKVAVVQGNIPQEMKWDRSARTFILQKYLDLSGQAAAGKPDLIVWPEAAFPFPGVETGDPGFCAYIRSIVDPLGVPLLLGAVTAAGEHYYNSALLYTPGQASAQHYEKIHLVPFGEYIPLRRVLPFLDTIVPIGDVSRGSVYTLFKLAPAGGPAVFSVLICFEDVFPELSRRFVLEGAQFLVTITNDAWYGHTAAADQHLAASVLRAVENRVWVVRCANTGISGFIRTSGQAVALVRDEAGKDIFVDGVLAGEVPLRAGPGTLYARWGDVFVLLCILGVFAGLACAGRVVKNP